jgi:hypothetical protein
MKYEIRVKFEANTELEKEQLEDLLYALSLQLEEPMTWKGEEETWNAKDIQINILEKAKDVFVDRRNLL